jgi:hypothetical protein
MLAAIVAASMASGARAQTRPGRFAEYRADVIVGRGTAGQVGAGAELPLGYYVRLGITGAAGMTWRDGATPTSGRVDVIARYLLDPFREVPRALSLGGGISVPYVEGDQRVRPYLTLVADLEGPRMHNGPFSPALQVGVGGGSRIAVVLRASRGPWR